MSMGGDSNFFGWGGQALMEGDSLFMGYGPPPIPPMLGSPALYTDCNMQLCCAIQCVFVFIQTRSTALGILIGISAPEKFLQDTKEGKSGW